MFRALPTGNIRNYQVANAIYWDLFKYKTLLNEKFWKFCKNFFCSHLLICFIIFQENKPIAKNQAQPVLRSQETIILNHTIPSFLILVNQHQPEDTMIPNRRDRAVRRARTKSPSTKVKEKNHFRFVFVFSCFYMVQKFGRKAMSLYFRTSSIFDCAACAVGLFRYGPKHQ